MAARDSASRTFGSGKLGNLDKLCGIMTPEKTDSKLRSTPAPYLAQAPAPKLGVGVDLNRDRGRVSCLLGPDTVLTRTRPHRDTGPTLLRCAADFKLVVRTSDPTELRRKGMIDVAAFRRPVALPLRVRFETRRWSFPIVD